MFFKPLQVLMYANGAMQQDTKYFCTVQMYTEKTVERGVHPLYGLAAGIDDTCMPNVEQSRKELRYYSGA